MSHIVLNDKSKHVIGRLPDCSIETIAFALSNINRFTGHVGQYSVAQHSVLVTLKLPPELRLSGLMHDAHEALIGDVASPVKVLLPEYKKIEQQYHDHIDSIYRVDTRHPDVIDVDLRILVTEAIHFGLWSNDGGWPRVPNYNDVFIAKLTPKEACQLFIDTYYALV